MKTFVVSNRKGGCGKTTTALAMFSYLGAVSGKKVLLVDADSQGNATYATGADSDKPGLYGVLTGKRIIHESLQAVGDGRYVLSASAALSNLENGIEQISVNLRAELEKLACIVDYVIIDTAPALGTLTVLALSAADSVIIPMAADVFNLQGLAGMYELVQAVEGTVKIEGILLTRFRERLIINRQLRDMIDETASAIGTRVFETKIRDGVTIPESIARQQGLFEYDPELQSNVAQDYKSFMEELGVA